MQNSWATSGVDLHLDRSGSGIRVGLEDALREAIRDGRLTAGARIPSTRALASDLGVARNTVAEAYAQLTAEGWLVARQGSGTRIAEHGHMWHAVQNGGTGEPPHGGMSREWARFDLRPGKPDVSAFPRSRWTKAARVALTAAPLETLGYSDPRGLPVLRSAIADYVARVRGVHASADQVVSCAGFTQGWTLLCSVLGMHGLGSLAMERYGVTGHRQIADRAGFRMIDLTVDDRGAVIEPGRAAAMLLTPAHQFPTGVVLHPRRRAAAVDWARESGGLIVEDDYDGEFRYDRQPVGALQALAPDLVVYAGTASKSLIPGLRIGWLVLPDALVAPVAEAQALAIGNVSAIDQLTLAELVTSGGYDRQVRRTRLLYRGRLEQLQKTVSRYQPQVTLTGIAAGLHALLSLPDGVSESEVIAAGAARGLALDGLSRFSAAGADDPPQALVIGYATPPQHTFSASLARLAATLDDVVI